jgi:hypothetical protein
MAAIGNIGALSVSPSNLSGSTSTGQTGPSSPATPVTQNDVDTLFASLAPDQQKWVKYEKAMLGSSYASVWTGGAAITPQDVYNLCVEAQSFQPRVIDGGATEGDNAAIWGTLSASQQNEVQAELNAFGNNIITNQDIFNACAQVAAAG